MVEVKAREVLQTHRVRGTCVFILPGDDLSCIVLGAATGTCFVDSGVCAVDQDGGGSACGIMERGFVRGGLCTLICHRAGCSSIVHV